jgi:putative PIN family toxin of toxin-antitoxin system
VIRITLDTNEYVSAFNFRGKALELIHQAISGKIEIAISQPIMDETLRVLREKFEWPANDLHDLQQRLLKTCRLVEPKGKLAVLGDEPDNRILECAQEAGSDYILTEDRAMLRIKEHAGAKVMRASEFSGLESGRGPQRKRPE